jgi:plasmid stability protein
MKLRLRLRAASHSRSMGKEARAILKAHCRIRIINP